MRNTKKAANDRAELESMNFDSESAEFDQNGGRCWPVATRYGRIWYCRPTVNCNIVSYC